MGMLTMFLKARLLQKLLGAFTRGSHGAQIGRSAVSWLSQWEKLLWPPSPLCL